MLIKKLFAGSPKFVQLPVHLYKADAVEKGRPFGAVGFDEHFIGLVALLFKSILIGYVCTAAIHVWGLSGATC